MRKFGALAAVAVLGGEGDGAVNGGGEVWQVARWVRVSRARSPAEVGPLSGAILMPLARVRVVAA
jgi:hypothetical protein